MKAPLPSWLSETGPGIYSINAWQLEAPTLEYVADGCEFQNIGGMPTISLWQQGPNDLPLSVVAISMSPGQLREALASFRDIRKHLADKLVLHYKDAVVPTASLANIPPERYRRFMAVFVRAASNENLAMLDFYNAELLTAQRVQAIGQINPIIRDLLRVWAPPTVLARMLKLLDAHVGGADAT